MRESGSKERKFKYKRGYLNGFSRGHFNSETIELSS
jgi:hypothetical protein